MQVSKIIVGIALLLLVGCIPPYTWNVIRETKLETYEEACVRTVVSPITGVLGVVSTLPSQSYTISGKPLPRYRQFLVETKFGIAHLNIRNNEGPVEVSASFVGWDEKPEGVETEGAEILENIIGAIERQCGKNI